MVAGASSLVPSQQQHLQRYHRQRCGREAQMDLNAIIITPRNPHDDPPICASFLWLELAWFLVIIRLCFFTSAHHTAASSYMLLLLLLFYATVIVLFGNHGKPRPPSIYSTSLSACLCNNSTYSYFATICTHLLFSQEHTPHRFFRHYVIVSFSSSTTISCY